MGLSRDLLPEAPPPPLPAVQMNQVFTYVSSVSMDSPRAAPPWMDSMAVE